MRQVTHLHHIGKVERYAREKRAYPLFTSVGMTAHAYAQWAKGRPTHRSRVGKGGEGAVGRIYPWGDELEPSAAEETGVFTDQLTRVGNRPAAASPYGVNEVAGKRMEWTADWYQPYDGNPHRIVIMGRNIRCCGEVRGWRFGMKPRLDIFDVVTVYTPLPTMSQAISVCRCVRDYSTSACKPRVDRRESTGLSNSDIR